MNILNFVSLLSWQWISRLFPLVIINQNAFIWVYLRKSLFFSLVRMSACTCLHVAVMGHSRVSFLRSYTPWFWGRGLFTGLGLTSWARLPPSKSHKSCLSLSSAGIACTSCCPWFLCGCCGSAEFMLLWQALYWLSLPQWGRLDNLPLRVGAFYQERIPWDCGWALIRQITTSWIWRKDEKRLNCLYNSGSWPQWTCQLFI